MDGEEAEERGDGGDDDGDEEEAAGLSEDAVGGKQEAQDGEFTDETREAEFSLESNLPADGDQEKHLKAQEGLSYYTEVLQFNTESTSQAGVC